MKKKAEFQVTACLDLGISFSLKSQKSLKQSLLIIWKRGDI